MTSRSAAILHIRLSWSVYVIRALCWPFMSRHSTHINIYVRMNIYIYIYIYIYMHGRRFCRRVWLTARCDSPRTVRYCKLTEWDLNIRWPWPWSCLPSPCLASYRRLVARSTDGRLAWWVPLRQSASRRAAINERLECPRNPRCTGWIVCIQQTFRRVVDDRRRWRPATSDERANTGIRMRRWGYCLADGFIPEGPLIADTGYQTWVIRNNDPQWSDLCGRFVGCCCCCWSVGWLRRSDQCRLHWCGCSSTRSRSIGSSACFRQLIRHSAITRIN